MTGNFKGADGKADGTFQITHVGPCQGFRGKGFKEVFHIVITDIRDQGFTGPINIIKLNPFQKSNGTTPLGSVLVSCFEILGSHAGQTWFPVDSSLAGRVPVDLDWTDPDRFGIVVLLSLNNGPLQNTFTSTNLNGK